MEAIPHRLASFNAEKQGWRAIALRQRAAGFVGEASKGKRPGASGKAPGTEPGTAAGETNGIGTGRRGEIDAFISTLTYAGRKISRKNLWTVAGYRNPTEFQRFQRGDARATQSATTAFNRILRMSPDEFIRLLDRNSPAK